MLKCVNQTNSVINTNSTLTVMELQKASAEE
jgi:hypothetical protein